MQQILTVGAGMQFATISAAILAADQIGGNADIRVSPGVYTNDGGYLWDGINNVTIEGAGGTAKIVDPTYIAGGKAGIVTGGNNIVLKNLDISGVTAADGNGAGVRYDQGTLILDNVSLHNNQNGILGAPDPNGSITIESSNIYDNGTSIGNTHNIYIGDVAQFTLTGSYIHDANVGHEVKSRAENNAITDNVIADNRGTSSYSIDLPNGGNAVITGNVIEQGLNGQNHVINAYGEEGNLHVGTAVTFSNNTILNDSSTGAGPLWANNGAIITGTGNSAYNLPSLGTAVGAFSLTQLVTEPSLVAAEQAIQGKIANTTQSSTALTPTISTITGVPYTGIRLAGTSEAGSSVTLTDTVAGQTKVLGTTTATSSGAWSFMIASGLGRIDLSTVQDYSVSAIDAAGNTGSMAGGLFLTDTGHDVLTATPGVSELFAVMSNIGSDVINGFQTASAIGLAHDVIDFSGRGLNSFSQVQALMSGSSSTEITLLSGKTVTLTGVAPSALSAADFRFS